MTPLERLVRAVELDVTGEEGGPHYGAAVDQARLYVEATLRALARVQAVRDVAGEALERHWETDLGWYTDDLGRATVEPGMTGDDEKPADELTPAEALEVFDNYERAVLTDLEVKVDGAPAALRRALDRSLGEDDEIRSEQ